MEAFHYIMRRKGGCGYILRKRNTGVASFGSPGATREKPTLTASGEGILACHAKSLFRTGTTIFAALQDSIP